MLRNNNDILKYLSQTLQSLVSMNQLRAWDFCSVDTHVDSRAGNRTGSNCASY